MMKFGYGQASGFAFRWIDGYVELNDAQSLRVRTALDEWFAWHRRTQLPDYADLLVRAQAELAADATPEGMCAWSMEIRSRIATAIERALPVVAEVALTLAPAQIAAIEKRNAATNKEFRDDFLHRDPVKRRRAAVQREIERAESFYGSLDPAQREFVALSVASSPYDAEIAYTERRQRQQDPCQRASAVIARGRAKTSPGGRCRGSRAERSRRHPLAQGAAIAASARDCPSASAWSMVIALLITPEFMMPRMSSSCEYCGTMVMLLPAAADAAKAAIAALSSALID